MPELSFDRVLAIVGIVLSIVLLVLDKAGKLKGAALFLLLALAALMLVPLALGNSWVKETPWGILKFSKGLLTVSAILVGYSLLAIWISTVPESKAQLPSPGTGNPGPTGPAPTPATKPKPPVAPAEKSPKLPTAPRAVTPQSEPPMPVVSPDPNFGISSPILAARIIEEANALESLANECSNDYGEAIIYQHSHPNTLPTDSNGMPKAGPQGVLMYFWQNYQASHSDAIADMHKSLLYRLGTVKTESETRDYKSLKENEAIFKSYVDFRQSGWSFCMDVPSYTREMRNAAALLNRAP